MSAIDLGAVQRTMHALLAREGRRIVYHDVPSGTDLPVSPALSASPSGLLPAFVVAGEAVWREATGKGFALDIVLDPEAFLGYRLRGINDGSFTTLMLATMEAAAQVAQPGAIVVNDLNALWMAATDRAERSAAPAADASPEARDGRSSVRGTGPSP